MPQASVRRAGNMRIARVLLVLVVQGAVGIAVPAALASGDANSATCPGETESSPGFRVSLPDCRAYELVSPAGKNGLPVELNGSDRIPFLDGTHVRGSSIGAFSEAGSNQGAEGSDYVFTRAPGGWSPESISFPTGQFGHVLGNAAGTGQVVDVSHDFGKELLLDRPAGAKVVDIRFYLRTPDPSGVGCASGESAVTAPDGATTACASEVGRAVPQSAVEAWHEAGFNEGVQSPEIYYRGASRDLTRIFFNDRRPDAGGPNWLWPGDTTVGEGQAGAALYEYVGTHSARPTLVGVDNAGAQLSECGVSIGSVEGTQDAAHSYNAISASGETVFITTASRGVLCPGESPAVTQAYARIAGPGETETTVNIAGRAGCASNASCDVTAEPIFQGASSDGKKAYFTTTQSLEAADTDAGNDLYVCELPGDGAPQPTPTGIVNPCPSLRSITAGLAIGGARVQDVLAISEDGSHVYFTAEGVLTSSPNEHGGSAVEGVSNLYVASGGEIAFVGSLPSATTEAETTPDGEHLVFADSTPITPDASGEGTQLYEYDAETGALERISRGEGALDNQEANFSISSALPLNQSVMSPAGPQRSAISDDGQFVFFQSRWGLTPQAINNEVIGCEEEAFGECFEFVHAKNVYEFHAGHVYLISDGQYRNVEKGHSTTELVGASPSGNDIYLMSGDQLVPQDGDTQYDLYDARVDGGLPGLPAEPCAGAACRSASESPESNVAPGSVSFEGPGNLAPPAPVIKKAVPKSTPKTRLVAALKICRKLKGKRRHSCEVTARRRYGSHAKKSARKSRNVKAGS